MVWLALKFTQSSKKWFSLVTLRFFFFFFPCSPHIHIHTNWKVRLYIFIHKNKNKYIYINTHIYIYELIYFIYIYIYKALKPVGWSECAFVFVRGLPTRLIPTTNMASIFYRQKKLFNFFKINSRFSKTQIPMKFNWYLKHFERYDILVRIPLLPPFRPLLPQSIMRAHD